MSLLLLLALLFWRTVLARPRACVAVDTVAGILFGASGSTSEPKGVMITHDNLADNLKLIVTGLKAADDTVVVGWLPQASRSVGLVVGPLV